MTIVQMYKKCPDCGRKYNWNPDVGKMICPYCGGFGTVRRKSSGKYLRRREDEVAIICPIDGKLSRQSSCNI